MLTDRPFDKLRARFDYRQSMGAIDSLERVFLVVLVRISQSGFMDTITMTQRLASQIF
jgi:hypothetical protein